MKKTTPKPRGPQDSTRRNVQAANKRLAAIEQRLAMVEEEVARLRATLLPELR